MEELLVVKTVEEVTGCKLCIKYLDIMLNQSPDQEVDFHSAGDVDYN
jgi:hypothetical protein